MCSPVGIPIQVAHTFPLSDAAGVVGTRDEIPYVCVVLGFIYNHQKDFLDHKPAERTTNWPRILSLYFCSVSKMTEGDQYTGCGKWIPFPIKVNLSTIPG